MLALAIEKIVCINNFLFMKAVKKRTNIVLKFSLELSLNFKGGTSFSIGLRASDENPFDIQKRS